MSLKGHSTVAVEGRHSEINGCAEGKAADQSRHDGVPGSTCLGDGTNENTLGN